VKVFAFVMILGFSSLSFAQTIPQVFKSLQADKGAWRVELVFLPSPHATVSPYTVCTADPLAAITYEKLPAHCEKRLVTDTVDKAVEESVCPTGTSVAVLTRSGQSVILQQTSAAAQVSTWRFTALGACDGKAI
jgi:hypothetical protein